MHSYAAATDSSQACHSWKQVVVAHRDLWASCATAPSSGSPPSTKTRATIRPRVRGSILAHPVPASRLALLCLILLCIPYNRPWFLERSSFLSLSPLSYPSLPCWHFPLPCFTAPCLHVPTHKSTLPHLQPLPALPTWPVARHPLQALLPCAATCRCCHASSSSCHARSQGRRRHLPRPLYAGWCFISGRVLPKLVTPVTGACRTPFALYALATVCMR